MGTHRLSDRMLIAIAVAGTLAGCATCGPPRPPAPAVQPVLEAVLRSGAPPTFARRIPGTGRYQVLPARAAILRLASPYPNSMKVFLTPSAGARRELVWVSRDDIAGQQAHDEAGYYSVENDIFGYSLIVSPPPAERTGPGFSVEVVNLSPGGTPPESPPLTVAIEARSTVTAPSSVFFDCGGDFDAFEGRYHGNCKPSSSIVIRDFALQGWLVNPHANCLGDLCIEDFHYNFIPDPDFIDEYYGRSGVLAGLLGSAQSLEDLPLHGNPPVTQPAVALADRRPTGESRGITLNSFLLAGNTEDARGLGVVIAELNAWHPAPQGGLFKRHWFGRGPAPAGWVTPAIDPSDAHFTEWQNTRWPFDPRHPDGGPELAPGQYVRVFGTLWQDTAHAENGVPNATTMPWAYFNGRLGAWLELHPVDWLEPAVAPPVRKTPFVVETIIYSSPTAEVSRSLAPDDPAPSAGWTLRCRELIDGRYTDTQSVTRREVQLHADRLDVTVAVARRIELGSEPPPGQPRLDRIIPGRFKAVYVLWWEEGPAAAGCIEG